MKHMKRNVNYKPSATFWRAIRKQQLTGVGSVGILVENWEEAAVLSLEFNTSEYAPDHDGVLWLNLTLILEGPALRYATHSTIKPEDIVLDFDRAIVKEPIK